MVLNVVQRLPNSTLEPLPYTGAFFSMYKAITAPGLIAIKSPAALFTD